MRDEYRMTVPVSIPADADGYTGRQCSQCNRYFKVIFGTGIRGDVPCHCPYCGHCTSHNEFWTNEQAEYAKSVAFRALSDAVGEALKDLTRKLKPRGPSLISLSFRLKEGGRPPLYRYSEKDVETHIECSSCTLKYAVYGVFAFCPDCGQHNSLQILEKSLEVVGHVLDLATTVKPEEARLVVEDAIENCVSSFDAFGRELCRVCSGASPDASKAPSPSFQNLEAARQAVQSLFSVDISAGVSADEWRSAVVAFQKRHLIAHKMGVVDEEFLRKTAGEGGTLGRLVPIDEADVRGLVQTILKLSRYIEEHIRKEDSG